MSVRLIDETAGVLAALHVLLVSLCRARPDGAELLNTLASGGLRITLDEREGLLVIGRVPAPGQPVEWLESVPCHPATARTFGLALSQVPEFDALRARVGAAAVTH